MKYIGVELNSRDRKIKIENDIEKPWKRKRDKL
jgi:hypothetical protein